MKKWVSVGTFLIVVLATVVVCTNSSIRARLLGERLSEFDREGTLEILNNPADETEFHHTISNLTIYYSREMWNTEFRPLGVRELCSLSHDDRAVVREGALEVFETALQGRQISRDPTLTADAIEEKNKAMVRNRSLLAKETIQCIRKDDFRILSSCGVEPFRDLAPRVGAVLMRLCAIDPSFQQEVNSIIGRPAHEPLSSIGYSSEEWDAMWQAAARTLNTR